MLDRGSRSTTTSRRDPGRVWRLAAPVVAAVAVLAVAGCGSSGDSSTNSATSAGSATTGAPASSSSGPTVEDLTGAGSYEAKPPTTGPPPAKGKLVYWVSCGLVIPDCSVPAKSAQAAAKTLGINFKIADGKLNAGGGDAAAVRTALAAKPDVIIIHGISCPIVKQPLEEAKKAGVKVMGIEALDCSDPPDSAGASLFTANMLYTPKAKTGVEYFQAWGRITAQYMIAAMGGKMNYIQNHGTEPLQENLNIGFNEEMKTCSGCKKLDEVTFTSADLIPNGPWLQRFRAALVKNPTADAIMYPFDANSVGAGGAKAAHEALPDAKQFGGSGQGPALDLVRSGVMTAVTGAHSPVWMGYAAMDNINRVLNDKPTVPEGVGFRPVDKDHNLPSTPGTDYQSPIDFKALYEKLWSSSK